MTSEQVERLRKGLGSTATSTTQEDVTKLLDEREALLVGLKSAADNLLWAHSAMMHSWSQEKPCENESAEEAGKAEEVARAVIAKAESP